MSKRCPGAKQIEMFGCTASPGAEELVSFKHFEMLLISFEDEEN